MQAQIRVKERIVCFEYRLVSVKTYRGGDSDGQLAIFMADVYLCAGFCVYVNVLVRVSCICSRICLYVWPYVR